MHYKSSGVECTSAMWQSYLFSDKCQICVKCPHSSLQLLHMCINFPYTSMKYLAYMTNLVGIFASSTFLTVTSKVCIVIGCVVAYMSKSVGSVYPFNMLIV